MHIGSHGQPDREWVAWAEAESVRRLTQSLQEIRERKQAESVEDMERSVAGWDPDGSPSVPESEIVLSPPPPPGRIIRIHSENLLDA